MKALLNQFLNKKIIVVGDVMIDSYIHGEVKRMSPEAAVPVLDVQSTNYNLGGAANVALNLKALGAMPLLISIIGTDANGVLLETNMNEQGLIVDYLFKNSTRKTTVKTRLMYQNKQQYRIDDETLSEIDEEDTNKIYANIEQLIATQTIDAIVFQDYNKGVLTANLIHKIIELANKNNVITTADPKHTNFFEYKNVTLFKPNLSELERGLCITIDSKNQEALQLAAEKLKSIMPHKYSIFTLSENGIYIHANLNEEVKSHLTSALASTVSDVSGAGDTVISVATLALLANADCLQIATLANIAAAIVCCKAGVATVSVDEMIAFAK